MIQQIPLRLGYLQFAAFFTFVIQFFSSHQNSEFLCTVHSKSTSRELSQKFLFWFLQNITTTEHVIRECKKKKNNQIILFNDDCRCGRLCSISKSCLTEQCSIKSDSWKKTVNDEVANIKHLSLAKVNNNQLLSCSLDCGMGVFLLFCFQECQNLWLELGAFCSGQLQKCLMLWTSLSSQDMWDSTIILSLHRYLLDFSSSTCGDDRPGTFFWQRG